MVWTLWNWHLEWLLFLFDQLFFTNLSAVFFFPWTQMPETYANVGFLARLLEQLLWPVGVLVSMLS